MMHSHENVKRHAPVPLHVARQRNFVIQKDLSKSKALCNSSHDEFYGEFQAPHPLAKLEGHTSCWLSINLQVPSTSEYQMLNLQPEDMPCWGDRSPINKFLYFWGSSLVGFLIMIDLNFQNSSHYLTIN